MSPVKYTKVNLTKMCLKHVIVLIMNLTFVVSLYKKNHLVFEVNRKKNWQGDKRGAPSFLRTLHVLNILLYFREILRISFLNMSLQ